MRMFCFRLNASVKVSGSPLPGGGNAFEFGWGKFRFYSVTTASSMRVFCFRLNASVKVSGSPLPGGGNAFEFGCINHWETVSNLGYSDC
ncbi:unnamed protein product [Ilex paraguariensis]|uniref:Uncharacterized protein n=1 Tax=Ilex paraguariensis TaxID=185542 RepID=A0ABC8UKB1_9AQUA